MILSWHPTAERIEYAIRGDYEYRILPADFAGYRLIRKPLTPLTQKQRRTKWCQTRRDAHLLAEDWATPHTDKTP
jgi:hypothetical protein